MGPRQSLSKQNKSVSLADVARRAGVSAQTVSRVVRGDPLVAKHTRANVRALLDELGYKPNLAARALAQRRTGVIHVHLAAPMFHGHAMAFLGIVESAAEAGWNVTVSSGIEALRDARNLAPVGSEGLIVLAGETPVVSTLSSLPPQLPLVVALAGDLDRDEYSTVAVDDDGGARLAAEHLVAHGVAEVMHVLGPQQWLAAARRRAAFASYCAERDVRVREVPAGSWNADDGYASVSKLQEVPTAIFASNDHLALGTMRAVLERGMSIPGDVAVVGFDDVAEADSFFPPLTTLRLDFAAVGRTAVQELTSRIDGAPPQHLQLSPELVVRASTRVPAASTKTPH